jgi:hypothetical protein
MVDVDNTDASSDAAELIAAAVLTAALDAVFPATIGSPHTRQAKKCGPLLAGDCDNELTAVIKNMLLEAVLAAVCSGSPQHNECEQQQEKSCTAARPPPSLACSDHLTGSGRAESTLNPTTDDTTQREKLPVPTQQRNRVESTEQLLGQNRQSSASVTRPRNGAKAELLTSWDNKMAAIVSPIHFSAIPTTLPKNGDQVELMTSLDNKMAAAAPVQSGAIPTTLLKNDAKTELMTSLENKMAAAAPVQSCANATLPMHCGKPELMSSLENKMAAATAAFPAMPRGQTNGYSASQSPSASAGLPTASPKETLRSNIKGDKLVVVATSIAISPAAVAGADMTMVDAVARAHMMPSTRAASTGSQPFKPDTIDNSSCCWKTSSAPQAAAMRQAAEMSDRQSSPAMSDQSSPESLAASPEMSDQSLSSPMGAPLSAANMEDGWSSSQEDSVLGALEADAPSFRRASCLSIYLLKISARFFYQYFILRLWSVK